jgi:hypothetical protein
MGGTVHYNLMFTDNEHDKIMNRIILYDYEGIPW